MAIFRVAVLLLAAFYHSSSDLIKSGMCIVTRNIAALNDEITQSYWFTCSLISINVSQSKTCRFKTIQHSCMFDKKSTEFCQNFEQKSVACIFLQNCQISNAGLSV